MPPAGPDDDRLGQVDEQVRAAVRFAAITGAAAVVFLVLAVLWTGSCHSEDVATAACGAPQRMVLALAAPMLSLGGGLRAFWRTYQVWRDRGTWWAWQGAGWFLLLLMVLTLTLGAPPIAGLALLRGG